MKTLKAGDFPSCEACIYIANVGYKRCQLKPFTNEDGELFFPTISDYVDYCGQGRWYVESHPLPISYSLAQHILGDHLEELV